MIDMGSMDKEVDSRLVLALMSGKVSTALNYRLNENFKKAGVPLTVEQWNVLVILNRLVVATQQTICEETSFSKTTLTRLVVKMEEAGILCRTKSRADRRANYLRITRKGYEVYDKAHYVASRTLKVALNGLTKEDVAITQKSLHQVVDNLNRQGDVQMPEKVAELMKLFRMYKTKHH